MRATILAMLVSLAAFPAYAQPPKLFSPGEPPKSVGSIFLTSPEAATTNAPPPNVWPLTVKQFRWLYINEEIYTGPITFDGSDNPAVKIFAAKAGVSYPGWKEGEADWGEHVPPASKNEVFFVGGKAQGIVSITAWGIKGEKPVKLGLITLNVGGAPPAPRPIDPPPIVDPPLPDSAPIKAAGLHVLITFNPAVGSLTEKQQAILNGKKVRDYLDSKCAKGTDGRPAYRIWPTVTNATGDLTLWQDAFKRKRDADNWVIVSNGKSGAEVKLPDNEDAMIELLRKYGE